MAVVNVASKTANGADSTTLAFPGAVTPGSTLVVIGWGADYGTGSLAAPAISDSINGAWTTQSNTGLGGTPQIQVWIAAFPNCASGTPTVTVNPSTSISDFTFAICEVTGALASSVDKSNVIGGGSGTAASVASGTLAQANEVIFAVVSGDWVSGAITEDGTYTLLVENEDNAGSQAGSAQYKIVSTTTTDTADWTVPSGNWVTILQSIKTSAGGGVSVVPGTKALVLTAFAPTVATPRVVTPGTKALALTTFAPRVIADTKVTPGTRALAITAFAPTVATPRVVTPGTKALVLTGFAPTVATPRLVTPATKALVITGFAPAVAVAPSAGVSVVPGTLALTLTTYAPTVSAGSGQPAGGSASSHRRRRTAESRGNIQVQHRQSEHELSLPVLSATASLSVTLGRAAESPEQGPMLRVPQPPTAPPTPRRANPPLRIAAPMASATASLSLSVGYVPFYVTLLERKDADLAALQAKMDDSVSALASASSSTRKSLQSRIDALIDEVIELEDKLLLGV